MKVSKCKKCGYDNNSTVKYCQRCGQELRDKFSLREALDGSGGVSIAGMGSKNTSFGPLGVEAARQDAKAMDGGKGPDRRFVVDPLPDGSWFCPDCGFHNAEKSKTCNSCKREY